MYVHCFLLLQGMSCCLGSWWTLLKSDCRSRPCTRGTSSPGTRLCRRGTGLPSTRKFTRGTSSSGTRPCTRGTSSPDTKPCTRVPAHQLLGMWPCTREISSPGTRTLYKLITCQVIGHVPGESNLPSDTSYCRGNIWSSCTNEYLGTVYLNSYIVR